ncbi:MAG: agmatinase [Acidimicrobiales bacterium]|nr:agmatinase [Acidimicrobiales bacterium]
MTKREKLEGDQAFRSPQLAGRDLEMTFGGAVSFLRRNYTRNLDVADIVVSGIPFDMATSNRPGARFGPRAIRAASVGLAELDAYPWGFDPFDHVGVADYGDCFIDYGHPEEAPARIESHADTIIASDTMMVSLGGDHYVTYPLLKAHAKKFGPLALIHFDAHCDTWDDDGSRMDHGSMFLRALQEGIIDPSRSVQIGLRTYNSSEHGFTILGAPWVHREGVPAVLEVIADVVGDSAAYLTFDVDCLDPAFAPGTGTPVSGGLTTAQGLEAIRGLTDINVVGMDVVEVAPPYDVSEITALAAATIAHDFICVQAVKAGAKPQPYGRP